MADFELRRQLAAAAGVTISEEILDLIHKRLLATEKGSIPLTITYKFTIDEIGEMKCEMTSKCNVGLAGKTFTLESDGNQLRLFGASEEKPEPKPDTTKKPKKVSKKKSAAKATKALKTALAKAPSNGADSAPPPTSSAAKRLAIIASENEALYRAGTITRDQAEAAGVDVDKIDEAGTDHGLSDAEREAIEEMTT